MVFRFNHLKKQNMTYLSHMRQAFYLGYRLCASGVKVIVHGIFPDVYETAATETINELHKEIQKSDKVESHKTGLYKEFNEQLFLRSF
jgi:hypothetical protein